MFKWILTAPVIFFTGPALAQNVTCATRPPGDSSNACASTAFVANGFVPKPGGLLNSPGYITSKAGGSVALMPEFDASYYGVDGTGMTDNATAYATLEASVNASPNGARVVFPCGLFQSSVSLAFSVPNNRKIIVSGGGDECSTLWFPASNGISYAYGNQFSSTETKDLSLTTSDSTGAYTAIHLAASAGIANPNSAHSIVEDVSAHGEDGYGQSDYWGVGTFQDKVSFLDVEGFYVNGSSATGGIGVKTQGDSGNSHFNVVTNISRSNFAFTQDCVYIGSLSQGLTISGGTNCTGNNYGVYAPSGNTLNDQVTITGDQFGSNATADVYFGSPMSAVTITGNLFIPIGTAVDAPAGLINSTITGNAVQALNNGGGTAFNIGSANNSAESVTITANSCLSLAKCLNVASSGHTSRGIFQNNGIWNVTAPISNDSANFFQSGNMVNGVQLASEAGPLSSPAFVDTTFVNNILGSATNPTVASGFCSGATTVANLNGTYSFRISVGTGCSESVGTITMPVTAANGWACTATSESSNPIESLSGSTVTAVEFQNYSRTSGTTANWTDGDVLLVQCAGQ